MKTTVTEIHFSIETDENTASEIVAEVEAQMAARGVTIRDIGTVSHASQVGPAWDHDDYASAGAIHLLNEFSAKDPIAPPVQAQDHSGEGPSASTTATDHEHAVEDDQSFNEAWANMFDTSRSSTTFKKLAVTFDVVFERLPDTPPENYVTDKVIRPLYNSGVRIDSWRISDSSEFEV